MTRLAEAFRYLPGPPISKDDLKTVAEAVLTPGRLRANPDMVGRVVDNDAAAKAEVWTHDFGSRQIVPTAVLSGVYKLANLEDAQRRGLAIFWAHDLGAMISWIASTAK